MTLFMSISTSPIIVLFGSEIIENHISLLTSHLIKINSEVLLATNGPSVFIIVHVVSFSCFLEWTWFVIKYHERQNNSNV